jgi:hypothetical protein
MQATTFAPPEHVGPVVSLAVVSTLAPEPAVAAAFLNDPAAVCRLVDSRDLYLRYSILLI